MSDPNSISVAQLGARMHYAVPRILHNAGRLERLYTDISINHGISRLLKLVPESFTPSFVRKLRGRNVSGVPADKISVCESIGYQYAYKLRSAKTDDDRIAAFMWVEYEFSKCLLTKGITDSETIYGFNGASLNIFKNAKRRGIRCYLEQTIAPKRIENQILLDSAKVTRQPFSTDSHLMSRFIETEESEWDLADKILCASDFVKEGLVTCGVNPAKCAVVPYGVSLMVYGGMESRSEFRHANRPLRILFIGAVGSRKGIWTLLDAMSGLRDLNIECRIIGSITADSFLLQKVCPDNTKIIGPVPRSAIPGELMNSDVFCLPSLCEGSATVIYEALAAGLPVVTTFNSGSIVRDDVEGIIVPHSDVKALSAALRRLAEDVGYRQRLSVNAKTRSAEGSMEAYGQRLLSALSDDGGL